VKGAGRHFSFALLAILTGCSREARTLDPHIPTTPPVGPVDPRIPFYQANLYQIAQGGRYFSW
jgi:hypothetical protein